jgi:hypothetical protein
MIRRLLGEALIAAGEKISGTDSRDVWPGEYAIAAGRFESDGPDLAAPIPLDEVRCALDELPDSKLLRIAATIIAGWKPILLSTAVAALTDVDVLVQALRDRANQFEAVEADADKPFLTYPTYTPQFRDE